MQYLITADDYGISPIIDGAIEKAIEAGIVNSVAAFANVKDASGKFSAAKAFALKQKYPQIQLGLHFTIASGQRVSDEAVTLSPKIRGKRRRRFTSKISQPKRATEEDIRKELRAQIQVFEEAGITDIAHFSDHFGLLNHTIKGTKAMTAVVEEYNQGRAKKAFIRNPVFISQLIGDTKNCLDNSEVLKNIRLPIYLARFIHFASRFRLGKALVNRLSGKRMRGIDSLFLFYLDEQLENLERINQGGNGVPSTSYWVESYYGKQKIAMLECIFTDKLYPPPRISYPVNEQNPIAEVMVHLALPLNDYPNRAAYNADLQKLRDYGAGGKGVNIRYVRKGRILEYQKLLAYAAVNNPIAA